MWSLLESNYICSLTEYRPTNLIHFQFIFFSHHHYSSDNCSKVTMNNHSHSNQDHHSINMNNKQHNGQDKKRGQCTTKNGFQYIHSQKNYFVIMAQRQDKNKPFDNNWRQVHCLQSLLQREQFKIVAAKIRRSPVLEKNSSPHQSPQHIHCLNPDQDRQDDQLKHKSLDGEDKKETLVNNR